MNSLSLYVARESGLHQLNPLTKLTITFTLLVTGLIIPGVWSNYILFVIVILPLAAAGKVLKDVLISVLKISLPFAISILIIQSLFWGKGNSIPIAGLGAIYIEGVIFSILSIGRILVVIASFLLFAHVTRPDILMVALRNAGFPSRIAYVFVASLQIAPKFMTKANTIMDAQRSRGLETEGNLIVRARALVPIILPLVLSSLVELEERAIAIDARGFSSSKQETSLAIIQDSSNQRALRWLLMLLTLTLIIIRLIWPS